MTDAQLEIGGKLSEKIARLKEVKEWLETPPNPENGGPVFQYRISRYGFSVPLSEKTMKRMLAMALAEITKKIERLEKKFKEL